MFSRNNSEPSEEKEQDKPFLSFVNVTCVIVSAPFCFAIKKRMDALYSPAGNSRLDLCDDLVCGLAFCVDNNVVDPCSLRNILR